MRAASGGWWEARLRQKRPKPRGLLVGLLVGGVDVGQHVEQQQLSRRDPEAHRRGLIEEEAQEQQADLNRARAGARGSRLGSRGWVRVRVSGGADRGLAQHRRLQVR